jgi:hypothetical protein
VLGRFKSNIPLVPPLASLETPLFPVRLDEREDDAPTADEVVATAFVEADDETLKLFSVL